MEWVVSDQTEEALLDTRDQSPTDAGFETFYRGLWGKSVEFDIVMPSGVPSHTGHFLREVTPLDICLMLKRTKKLQQDLMA